MSILDEAIDAISDFFNVGGTVESKIGEGAGYATGYVAGYVLGGAVRAQAMASFGASVGASVLDGGWNADPWLPVVEPGPTLSPEQQKQSETNLTPQQQKQGVSGSGAPVTQLTGATTGEVVPGYMEELPAVSGQAAAGDSASLEQRTAAAAQLTTEQSKAAAGGVGGSSQDTRTLTDVLREVKYAGATAGMGPSDAEVRRALLYIIFGLGGGPLVESLIFPDLPPEDVVFKNPIVRDAVPYSDWNADAPTSTPVDEALVMDEAVIRGSPNRSPGPAFSDILQKMYGGEPSAPTAGYGGEPLPIGEIVGEQPPAVTTVEPSPAPTAPATGAMSPGLTSGAQGAPAGGSFGGAGGGPPFNEAPAESLDLFAWSLDDVGAPKGSWQRGALKGAGKFLVGLHPIGRLYLFGSAAYDRLTDPNGVTPGSLADFYLGNIHPGYQMVKTAIAAEQAWTSNNDEVIAEIGTETILSLVSMLIIGRAIGAGAVPERAAGEVGVEPAGKAPAAGDGAAGLDEPAGGLDIQGNGDQWHQPAEVGAGPSRPRPDARLPGSYLDWNRQNVVPNSARVPLQGPMECGPYSTEIISGVPAKTIIKQLGPRLMSDGVAIDDLADALEEIPQTRGQFEVFAKGGSIDVQAIQELTADGPVVGHFPVYSPFEYVQIEGHFMVIEDVTASGNVMLLDTELGQSFEVTMGELDAAWSRLFIGRR